MEALTLDMGHHPAKRKRVDSLQGGSSLTSSYGDDWSLAGLDDSQSDRASNGDGAGPSISLKASSPSDVPFQWYVRHLDKHIKLSHLHTLGQSPRDRLDRFQSSFVQPSDALWSVEEKLLLFASLSRHSRLRIDLIAADLATKSQSEVEWYLTLLEAGAEEMRRTDGMLRGYRDRSKRWKRSHRWKAELAESAREVSDGWLVKEEVLAGEVNNDVRRRDEASELIRRDSAKAKRVKEMRRAPGEAQQVRLAELERVWLIQDWGKVLDRVKIRLLDKLVMSEWYSWCAERSNETKKTSLSPSSSPRDSDSSLAMQTEGTREATSGDINSSVKSSVKTKRIADDELQLEQLSAIPKIKRSKEQKVMLALIQNRKRNRQKFRAAKLLAEGITLDEIAKQGGIDEIFALRGSGPEKSMIRGPSNRVATRENGSEWKRLRTMGMNSWIESKGWEIFNFDRMAHLLQRVVCLCLENS